MKEQDRRSEAISIRLSKSVRAQLETARHTSDGERSLSHEVDARLRQSLNLDDEIKKRLGGDGNYRMFQLFAECIALVEADSSNAKNQKRWFDDDRYLFDQVVSAINTVVEHFRPKGRRAKGNHFKESLGRQVGLFVLAGLQFAKNNPRFESNIPENNTREMRRRQAVIAGTALPLGRRLTKSPVKELLERENEIHRAAASAYLAQEQAKEGKHK